MDYCDSQITKDYLFNSSYLKTHLNHQNHYLQKYSYYYHYFFNVIKINVNEVTKGSKEFFCLVHITKHICLSITHLI
jgi:hypothetical protein